VNYGVKKDNLQTENQTVKNQMDEFIIPEPGVYGSYQTKKDNLQTENQTVKNQVDEFVTPKPAVGAGGAALTAISILVVSFFWALPQVLMSDELSLIMSVNGGNIMWVQAAFDFIGVVGAFPLNMANYLLPIFAGFILDYHLDHWQAGYFTGVVKLFFPYWLSLFMLVASAISNYCQLASAMASLSWTMWAMGKGRKDAYLYIVIFPTWYVWVT